MLNQKKFIIFEGIDGSGKSTLAKKLYNYLKKDATVKIIREPGSTNIGEKIRKILVKNDLLPQTQFFLFLAARSEIYNVLQDCKENIIIMDRSFLSTLAYQSILLNISIEKLYKLHYFITIPFRNPLVFILSANPVLLKNRLDENNIFHKKLSIKILKQIDMQYKKLKGIFQSYDFIYLNATKSIEYLFDRVVKSVNIYLSR